MSNTTLKIRDMIDPELLSDFCKKRVCDAYKSDREEMTANEMLDRLMRLYEDVDQERKMRFIAYVAYLPIVERERRICTDIARLLVSAKLCNEELDRDPKQLLDRMIGSISRCARTVQDDILTWDYGEEFHSYCFGILEDCFTLIRRLKVTRVRFDTITLRVAEENDILVAKAVVEEHRKAAKEPSPRAISADRVFTPSLPVVRPKQVPESAPETPAKLPEMPVWIRPYGPLGEPDPFDEDEDIFSSKESFERGCQILEQAKACGVMPQEQYEALAAVRDRILECYAHIDSS